MVKSTRGGLKNHFKTRNRTLAREIEALERATGRRRLDAAVREQTAEKCGVPW
jgi:hypothetical protein